MNFNDYVHMCFKLEAQFSNRKFYANCIKLEVQRRCVLSNLSVVQSSCSKKRTYAVFGL